jgi:hypothetical protein
VIKLVCPSIKRQETEKDKTIKANLGSVTTLHTVQGRNQLIMVKQPE